ncbi:peroxiredoxin family protein [Parasphingorhabdus sp. JC815]|uniref:peroxiredoxin family protein n=1 Tax=Parasphingorhabdus sp. JC815 TaxID=3232140 RepID=UPI00345962EB
MTRNALIFVTALVLASCSDNENRADTSEAEQTTAPEADTVPTIDVGLAIGETVPLQAKFATTDGETTLANVLKDGPAVLIFTRSVKWCPFCQSQLKGLGEIASNLEQRGYNLYGISYDSAESQDRFLKNQMLDYKMLSDESSAAIDAFGLRDPQYTEGEAVGVPYASIIIVDKNGTITGKSVSGDYTKRPSNDQILAMVDAI